MCASALLTRNGRNAFPNLRSIGDFDLENVSSMAACLMLLSRGSDYITSSSNAGFSSRVFECKTCNRQFPSFQALGGHRASHKKPRTASTVGDSGNESSSTGQSPPSKLRTHECSICGQEFSIGQALGGHMRRHRAAASSGIAQNSHDSDSNIELTLSSAERRVGHGSVQVPVVKKSSGRRVLWLDLNLTPTENDSKLEMVKPTTPIFCYL